MPSNAGRGAYYKGRSKRYLQTLGYDVADMELVRTVHLPRGIIPVKRDQWGADLIAKRADDLLFVQVKSVALGRSPDLAGARLAFADAGPWPPGTRRVVHVWRPRARIPEEVPC